MKHSPLHNRVLAAALAVCAAVGSADRATAQDVYNSNVFKCDSYCDHVINMIHRFGVNNSVDRSDSPVHRFGLGQFVVPGNEIGDLEINSVARIPHADDACGPKFSVLIHNNSIRKVCQFRVTAVAIFGHICHTSPCTTVKVSEIAPGETFEVIVQLPIEAFSMGNRDGQILGFQKLIVVIDSFDELLETNEANNIKCFVQSQIPVATVSVVQQTAEGTAVVQSNVVEQSTGQAVAPAQSATNQGAPAQAAPAAGAPNQSGSTPTFREPVDNDAGAEQDQAALRSAMEQLGSENGNDAAAVAGQ